MCFWGLLRLISLEISRQSHAGPQNMCWHFLGYVYPGSSPQKDTTHALDYIIMHRSYWVKASNAHSSATRCPCSGCLPNVPFEFFPKQKSPMASPGFVFCLGSAFEVCWLFVFFRAPLIVIVWININSWKGLQRLCDLSDRSLGAEETHKQTTHAHQKKAHIYRKDATLPRVSVQRHTD